VHPSIPIDVPMPLVVDDIPVASEILVFVVPIVRVEFPNLEFLPIIQSHADPILAVNIPPVSFHPRLDVRHVVVVAPMLVVFYGGFEILVDIVVGGAANIEHDGRNHV